MKYTKYCRSVLTTPALQTERYSKAQTSGADMCLVDLADSVAAQDKADARKKAEGYFATDGDSDRRPGLAVRINTVTTHDGIRDLLAIAEYKNKPDIVIVPRVESPRDLEIVDLILSECGTETDLFAIVETPRGLDAIHEIAHVTARLKTISFGPADYAFATGARLSWATLLHARARVVNSGHAAGLHVVDAPVFDLADMARLRSEAVLGRDLGFDGKVAIHPDQVPVINEVFSPDEDALEYARRVVQAGEDTGFNIGVVDGSMVGAPFFEASRRMLEEFGSADRYPGDRS